MSNQIPDEFYVAVQAWFDIGKPTLVTGETSIAVPAIDDGNDWGMSVPYFPGDKIQLCRLSKDHLNIETLQIDPGKLGAM